MATLVTSILNIHSICYICKVSFWFRCLYKILNIFECSRQIEPTDCIVITSNYVQREV